MKKINLKKAIELRHELHKRPELSNNEKWTKNYLIRFLKENTNLEIIDEGKWFYAAYRCKKNGKNIAFRAEMDALPMDEGIDLSYGSINTKIAHKCGHDGHSATLAAFALEIDQKGSENNIFFIFQHAEETGDGAKEAVKIIKNENIDEIYAYHNMSGMIYKSINLIEGIAHFSSKGMVIKLEGKPSHASEPEKGINPSFAIANIIRNIPKLLDITEKKGMILATIIKIDIGERAFGISASKGEILFTIRAQYENDLYKLQKNIENLVKKESKQYNLKLDFSYLDYFPETKNNIHCINRIEQSAKELNYEVIKTKDIFRGSEDFGYYLKETKGAIFYIGNGKDYPSLHSTMYDFRDEIIEIAVNIFEKLSN